MLVRWLIEILAPADCVGCSREGAWLCAACLDAATLPPSGCFGCGRPGSYGYTCKACARWSDLLGVAAGAYYEDAPRQLIAKLKFERARSAAVPATALLTRGLPRGFKPDAVTAVPIAPARYRERGYNQSELVGRLVARALDVPFRQTLLRRDARHQIGQGRAGRLEGIAGRFAALGNLEGQSLLVIDDVLTTGATLTECAAVLRGAGARAAFGAVIARVARPEDRVQAPGNRADATASVAKPALKLESTPGSALS